MASKSRADMPFGILHSTVCIESQAERRNLVDFGQATWHVQPWLLGCASFAIRCVGYLIRVKFVKG